MFWLQRTAFIVLAGILAGCQPTPSQPTLHPVVGTVTLDGLVVAHAQVSFHPLRDGAHLAVGHTDAHGNYRLTTRLRDDGAQEGEYAVTVIWPNTSLSTDECIEATAHDRLNGRYSDATKTPLRAKVTPGSNTIRLHLSLGSGSWSLPKKRDLEPRRSQVVRRQSLLCTD